MESADGLKTDEGKNKAPIHCSRCPSKILNQNVGVYTSIEFPLPLMHHKSEEDASEAEKVTDYWLVKDMYWFENIGFSNTINEKKYLICADCEIGPIGWHDLKTKENYLAMGRVKHDGPVSLVKHDQ